MARRRAGTLIPIEVDILECGITLQANEGNFYGFALAKQLSENNGSRLTAHGTLYKALSRMTDSGMLEAKWEHPTEAELEGRPRRRLYMVTADGARALAKAQAEATRSEATVPKVATASGTLA